MAYLELLYRSEVLKENVTVNVLLPEEAKRQSVEEMAPYKTLYLLHGLSGDRSTWMRHTSIERYAAEHRIAVVMPSVGRSWYTDTADGRAYLTFVTEELPRVCRGFFRGMSEVREDNLIAGLSMGGYGAVKAALARPDFFGACASLSGAMDIASKTRQISLEEWRGIFGFDLQSAVELKGTKHDIFETVRKNHAAGVAFPKLYLWCGTEDHLLQANRDFDALLNELDIPHCYEESEGNHSAKWWDLHIQDALRYLLQE